MFLKHSILVSCHYCTQWLLACIPKLPEWCLLYSSGEVFRVFLFLANWKMEFSSSQCSATFYLSGSVSFLNAPTSVPSVFPLPLDPLPCNKNNRYSYQKHRHFWERWSGFFLLVKFLCSLWNQDFKQLQDHFCYKTIFFCQFIKRITFLVSIFIICQHYVQ